MQPDGKSSAELARAYEAGRNARERRKERKEAPLYEMGPGGLTLRNAWRSGWDERDSEIKRRAA